MGLFATSFMGLFPLESILQGALAQGFGTRITLGGCALTALGMVALMVAGMSAQLSEH